MYLHMQFAEFIYEIFAYEIIYRERKRQRERAST